MCVESPPVYFEDLEALVYSSRLEELCASERCEPIRWVMLNFVTLYTRLDFNGLVNRGMWCTFLDKIALLDPSLGLTMKSIKGSFVYDLEYCTQCVIGVAPGTPLNIFSNNGGPSVLALGHGRTRGIAATLQNIHPRR